MNSDTPGQQCARLLLETVPHISLFIGERIRRQRTLGLSLPQYRALGYLSRIDDSSLSAVAGYLGYSLPSMSRLMEGLVVRRLVCRHPVPSNRRQIALTLTSRGRATLETMRNEIRLQLAEALKDLPANELRNVLGAVRTLQKTFDSHNAAEIPPLKPKR